MHKDPSVFEKEDQTKACIQINADTILRLIRTGQASKFPHGSLIEESGGVEEIAHVKQDEQGKKGRSTSSKGSDEEF